MKFRMMITAAAFSAAMFAQLQQAPQRPGMARPAPASARQLEPHEAQAREQENQAALASMAAENAVMDEGPLAAVAGHPLGCKRRVRIAGRADNFMPGPEPRYQSPVMQKFMLNKAQKGFDAVTLDSVFGVSFPLSTCKLCGEREPVIIDMVVKRATTGQLTPNDKIYVYVSNDSTPPGQLGTLLQTVQPWQGAPFNTQLLRNVQIQIPTSVINSAIWSAPGKSYLEVVMQDDTGIDYVRMISLSF